jgi:hypothetical protein
MAEHRVGDWSAAQEAQAFKLLESQRYGQYMFTSCGWFFDDLAGLEPVQNLRYAARALQLASDLDGGGWEEDLLGHLAQARSNHPEDGSGADIWRRQVASTRVGARRVAAHAVISGVLGETPPPERLYCYDLKTLSYSHRHNLGLHLSWGRMAVTHQRLGQTQEVAFAAMHSGGHDFRALVAAAEKAGDLSSLSREVEQHLRLLETAPLWQLLFERLGGGRPFTLRDLFLEGRRELAQQTLSQTMASFKDVAHGLYDAHRESMLLLHDINVPLPPVFIALAEVILSEEIVQALRQEEGLLPDYLGDLARQARSLGLEMDRSPLRRELEDSLTRLISAICADQAQEHHLARANGVLDLAASLGIQLDLWGAQNLFHRLLLHQGASRLAPDLAALGRRLRFEL